MLKDEVVYGYFVFSLVSKICGVFFAEVKSERVGRIPEAGQQGSEMLLLGRGYRQLELKKCAGWRRVCSIHFRLWKLSARGPSVLEVHSIVRLMWGRESSVRDVTEVIVAQAVEQAFVFLSYGNDLFEKIYSLSVLPLCYSLPM